jgi:hypothetical protein
MSSGVPAADRKWESCRAQLTISRNACKRQRMRRAVECVWRLAQPLARHTASRETCLASSGSSHIRADAKSLRATRAAAHL